MVRREIEEQENDKQENDKQENDKQEDDEEELDSIYSTIPGGKLRSIRQDVRSNKRMKGGSARN
jgi:hypothetical protein